MSDPAPVQKWYDAPELRAAFTAVQFLTRLPVPGGATRDLATFGCDIERGLKYFPLIGAGVAAISAVALLIASLALPFPVAVLVALAVEALITGAFHEDGVADFCDAFGAVRTKDDTLRILKDSRIGSFGVLGLVLMVALRAAALMSLSTPFEAAIALVVAGAMGRLLSLIVMAWIPPCSDGLAARVGARAAWSTVGAAALLAAPALAYGLWHDAAGIALAGLAMLGFALWFKPLLMRRLGGVTGDCLGFATYTGIVLTTLALARTPSN